MTVDVHRLLAAPFLAHAEHHAVLDSTQARARQLVEGGAKLPALVAADQQTAGRGRGSNRWWTGEGSLAFSLVIDPTQFGFPPQAVPRLSLAVAVAIVDAVAGRLEGRTLGLHWPNDVYVDGGKLAGILVEVLPTGHHIIGVGLNSNNTAVDAPEPIRAAIATLSDLTGSQHDHTELLIALMENLEAVLRLLGEPMETLGARFDLLCLQRGEVLTVHQGESTTTGLCAGISLDGSLLLDTPSGRRSFDSGTLKPRGDW